MALTGGNGQNAVATVVVSGGAVTSVSTLTGINYIQLTPGSGYTNGTYALNPTFGSGFVGTVTVSGGSFTSYTITSPGTGYYPTQNTTLPAGAGSGTGGGILVFNQGGEGYKLRDIVSAPASSLGGTGSGFTYQVSHFTANVAPVWDGVNDDTAAFMLAMAAAQNTGQSVLVPDGCWISTLNVPQGIAFFGDGYAAPYGYSIDSGTAYNMPILYEEGYPQFMFYFSKDPNDAFVGFEVNGFYNGGAYGTTYAIGTDQNGGGGDSKLFVTGRVLRASLRASVRPTRRRCL